MKAAETNPDTFDKVVPMIDNRWMHWTVEVCRLLCCKNCSIEGVVRLQFGERRVEFRKLVVVIAVGWQCFSEIYFLLFFFDKELCGPSVTIDFYGGSVTINIMVLFCYYASCDPSIQLRVCS